MTPQPQDRRERLLAWQRRAVKAEAELQQVQAERDEALQRMDEALAKQYAALQSYAAKIQDLTQETLRNSELREQRQQAIDALREIADGRKMLEAQKIARAVLLSLGEDNP